MHLHRLLLTSLVLITLGCSERNDPAAQSGDTQTLTPPTLRPFSEGWPKLTFDHDVSALLATEDDYITTLSAFDYAAKFDSDKPLNRSQRKAAYRAAIEEYTPREVARLKAAFERCFEAMEGMTVQLPDTIHIFSEEGVESGAAYTRAHTICMPKRFIGRLGEDKLADLAAHEMFHVISRHNLDLRPQMYAILGFQQVEPPATLPEFLGSRTIANPDAPGMDYVIECTWRGKAQHFLPILHSERDYSHGSFLFYIKDDLLAVKLVDGRAVPLLERGKPIIVKKEDVEGYFKQVGRNTHYTFHPEETTADHFMLLIRDRVDTTPNPDKIRALGDILRR